MEQVMVRRIAVSKSSDWAAAAYLFHAVITSLVAFSFLLFINIALKDKDGSYHYLIWFFSVQAIVYISVPFRQFLNAKERFGPFGAIALISNICKLLITILLIRGNKLSIISVALVLVGCAVFELTALLIYITAKTNFRWYFKFIAYKKLFQESLPQYIAVIFDSSLSRMDWILLGIISTKVVTADYSFAYRAYEIARLPILIIAPIILPKFARRLATGNNLSDTTKNHINQLFALEMFFAVFMTLCLNIVWARWIGGITHGKYGSSNAVEFFILSLCIPLQFFINLLWTLSFAGRKYRAVSKVTVITAITNIVLNLILIPIYGGIGAAIAFLISSSIQVIGYYRLIKDIMLLSYRSFVGFVIIATTAYIAAIYLSDIIIVRLVIAVVLYSIISVVLQQIGNKHLQLLKLYFRK